MELDTVHARRLATQGLTRPYGGVEDAVRHLLAVQSQDAPLARWSLAMRTGAVREEEVRAVVDSGRVVRTHVLRPTWHYVHAEDLRWLLGLTSPKVVSAMAARHRQLGLDDPAVVRREHAWLADTLAGGNHLTRRQLARDDLRGERLGHLLMLAELDGLVCSGPLARGQHTYALVEEWVPPAPPRDREEAVRELVLRFFTGHGPASVAHLDRWTTLTRTEVTTVVADLGDALERVEAEGHVLLQAAGARDEALATGTWLLPLFDEAYLTYPGSTLPRAPDHPWLESGHSFAESGGGLVVSDLRDVGWWKRKDVGRTTRVTLGLAPSLGPRARRQVEDEAEALAAYTGRRLDLVLQT